MSLKDALQAQLQVIATQIAQLERLPETNPLGEGDVLVIERTFTGVEKPYTYCMVYANEIFWASANNRAGKAMTFRSWNDVLAWLTDRCVSMRLHKRGEGTELVKE